MLFLPGLADVLILAVTACVFFYLYATKNRNFWKEQNIVHEEFSLVFGPARRLFSKPTCMTDQERYQKMGRLFGIYEGGKPTLVVAEPDLVKQVLLKDFQLLPNRMVMITSNPTIDNMMVFSPVENWRRIRPAASPAFSTGKLRKMNALIQDCAKTTCGHLKAAAEEERDVDIKQFFGHYALDVIARCAFGTKLDSHTDATNEFVTQARSAFSSRISFRMIIAVLFPGLVKSFSVLTQGGALEYFRKVCQRIISNRRHSGQRQEDFLQLMMDAQDGNLAQSVENSTDPESKLFDIGVDGKSESTLSAKRLSEEEAMAQCVLFFLAGQDTTSSTVAFAAYLLALHPDVQDKLRKEVDECMAMHGPEPSLDVISRLKYLHCVTSEVLRLYPPAARLQRIAHDEYTLGETGILVPKKCAVVIPVYAMHRDPEFFPDPANFDPERFSDENVDSVRPYTYLPFGAGPRNCIGMRLALQAVKLCLLHSVHNVQFVRTGKTKVPLKIKRGLGILTAEDITVGIRRRPRKQSRQAR